MDSTECLLNIYLNESDEILDISLGSLLLFIRKIY